MSTRPLVYRTTPTGLLPAVWRAGSVICFGYDLFLSHAHCDGRAYALALWPRLEELGLTVCFDRCDFHVGDRLHVKMNRSVASSGGLLLLDTPKARASVEVVREFDAAIERSVPVLLVRREDLASEKWAAADAPDPLIYSSDSKVRFDEGDPSAEVIGQINASLTARRVETKFRRLVKVVAAVLMMLAGWSFFERAFAMHTAAIYVARHDPRVSIDDLDRSLEDLSSSWVWGTFGWQLHDAAMRLLHSEVARVQVKAIEWNLTQVVAASSPIPQTFGSPWSESATHAVVPSHATVLAVCADAVCIYTPSGVTQCPAMAGTPTAVAVDRDGTRVAVATTAGVFSWDGLRCATEPRPVELLHGAVGPGPMLKIAFGDHGRSLLLAWSDRVISLECRPGRACRERVLRTVADATPAGTADEDAAFGPLQFCEAVMSPASALVVTSVGHCRNDPARTICAFANSMTCERRTDGRSLSFDPTGAWLVASRPALTRWDVRGMMPSNEARPAAYKNWTFTDRFKTLGPIDKLAFRVEGHRLLTVTHPHGPVLSYYVWPRVEVLHVEPLPEQPDFLLVETLAVVGTRTRPIAFDVRR
jgi:TIR domain